MSQRIPVTVITGFLGAGKTSLIRHLIEQNQGKRLAFLINEFGDLGIDGELLKGCIEGCNDDDIIELSNGCICCTVADDFLPAMEALLERNPRPDHILIETSGLALPKPLVQAFTWPSIKTSLTVDGVVTVVDSAALAAGGIAHDIHALEEQRQADEALDHESPIEELFEDQLQCADLVLLNKADLVDEEGLARAHKAIQPYLRIGTSVTTVRNAEANITQILGIEAGAEDDLDSRKSHHDHEGDHDHEDFESFIITGGQTQKIAELIEATPDLAHRFGILRMKGFLHNPVSARRQVFHAVGPRASSYFDREWHDGEAKESKLVVIGHHDFDQRAIEQEIGKLLF